MGWKKYHEGTQNWDFAVNWSPESARSPKKAEAIIDFVRCEGYSGTLRCGRYIPVKMGERKGGKETCYGMPIDVYCCEHSATGQITWSFKK